VKPWPLAIVVVPVVPERVRGWVKMLLPEKVLESPRSVDDANVHVEVAKVYTAPEASVARAPFVMPPRVTVPLVVSPPLNVCSALQVFVSPSKVEEAKLHVEVAKV